MLVVSIVGTDRYAGGYGAAKVAHEQAALAGPIPTRIVRATQFHEFVEQLLAWGTQGDVAYVQTMRTQPVAARTVAETLADMIGDTAGPAITEVAGPQEESMGDLAARFVDHRGLGVKVDEVSDPDDPDARLAADGGLLPGPDVRRVGPTFEQWLGAG
jgi:dTDP-4-dehydrorhamnose reductase